MSRYLTRKGLRILAYHNFTSADEFKWLPKLCIDTKTFQNRLQTIKDQKFRVMDLTQAIESMYNGTLPDKTMVITIDDGWYNTMQYAHPLLTQLGFPYTIYLTSYYSMKRNPVFNLAVNYMFWKTKKKQVELNIPDIPVNGIVNLSIPHRVKSLLTKIIDHGNSLSEAGRDTLCEKMGRLLEIEYSDLKKSKIVNILNADEIKKLSQEGVDIQLHSHRHRWPLHRKKALQEIRENKAFISPLTEKDLCHFCYPSGIWHPDQFPWLEEEKIKTATTCHPDLNYSHTHRFMLNRILDSKDLSPIEFEAEISGFMPFLRKLKKLKQEKR